MQPDPQILFYILVLILSVVLHEIAHGYAALWFGDKTAQRAGRLTLNPIPHLDLFGSILLPAFLILTNAGIYFGWAKPVPYNPDNLQKRRLGEFVVASAGIVANILLAIIFSGIAVAAVLGGKEQFATGAILIASVNLSLGLFNLLPLPPFDGYKIVKTLLFGRMFFMLRTIEERMRGFEIFALIAILFLFSSVLGSAFVQLVQLLVSGMVSLWVLALQGFF